MRRVALLALGALTAAVAILTAGLAFERPASAAFGGKNGQIAFVSTRDGNEEIYVTNADGSGQTRLTTDPHRDVHPAFSPDGKHLTFTSRRPADTSDEIYVMDARDADPADGTGDNLVKITGDPPRNFMSVYSPDGSRIAFVRNEPEGDSELWVMNVDGTGGRRLTDNAANEIRPAFSPDGETIAFTRRDPANPDPTKRRDDIYLIGADGVDGVDERRLTTHPAADTTANFSPDGGTIAFNSARDRGTGEIYTMGLDGTSVSRLTTNEATDEFPAFSPDGTQLAFSSDRDGDAEIFVMDRDGSDQRPLTDNPAADFRPDWGPFRYDFGGFLWPISNPPATNPMVAGFIVPVRFALGGDQGLGVMAAGYPQVQETDCDTGTPVGTPQQAQPAFGSDLLYNPRTGNYVYLWKTSRTLKGTCQRLVVRLDDTTEHVARFRFK